MHIYYADEKTETSTAIPTEAILPPTTESTTTALDDEHESSKSEQSSDNWKIGMSVGVVLVVLFTAIGKILLQQLIGVISLLLITACTKNFLSLQILQKFF